MIPLTITPLSLFFCFLLNSLNNRSLQEKQCLFIHLHLPPALGHPQLLHSSQTFSYNSPSLGIKAPGFTVFGAYDKFSLDLIFNSEDPISVCLSATQCSLTAAAGQRGELFKYFKVETDLRGALLGTQGHPEIFTVNEERANR